MSRVRVAYTAGEAIGPDLFVFYRSIGINLKQLYGSTETSVFVCVQPDGHVRDDTVGPPVEGVDIRVADNGEILVKSPGLFKEYYRNPEATAEARDDDGWFHTGDAGYLDSDGQLKIIDRAKDVGKLADGSLFAPKYIENKLKFFPYIKEAVAFGNGRDDVRLHQHRPRGGGQLGRTPRAAVRGLYRPGRQGRGLRLCCRTAWRRSTPTWRATRAWRLRRSAAS